jgi:hypothetical protein
LGSFCGIWQGENGASPFCRRRAKEGPLRLLSSGIGPYRRTSTMPAACLWPKHRNSSSAGRSSGLRLQTVPSILPADGPRKDNPQWHFATRGLADHSSGPATDLHRLPFSSPPSQRESGNLSRRRNCFSGEFVESQVPFISPFCLLPYFFPSFPRAGIPSTTQAGAGLSIK